MTDKPKSDAPKVLSEKQQKTKINRRKMAKKSRLANKRKARK